MTNRDFWTSIDEIITNGFTSNGLKILERYADEFITGQLIYKRFSPFEQHGCSKGGALHVIASLLAGAEITADKLFAPEGSFKREQQQAEIQTERIEKWSRHYHCWFDNVDSNLCTLLGEQIAEGGEAHVFDHGNTIIKYIGLDYFVQPILALDRISLHNAYFPETAMTVIGFGKTADGKFQIVVEQPFICGTGAEENEITEFVSTLGFSLVNPKNWTYANETIYLSDLHDENVLKSESGRLFVIDCDIRINTPEIRCGGSRILSTEVEVNNIH